MPTKKFQRCKEDFKCARCGFFVKGTGYTNHCSGCLWGKHVDNNPGDRLASCQGLMEPVSVETKNNKYVLIHRCLKCGFERKNKTSKYDNFDVLLELARK